MSCVGLGCWRLPWPWGISKTDGFFWWFIIPKKDHPILGKFQNCSRTSHLEPHCKAWWYYFSDCFIHQTWRIYRFLSIFYAHLDHTFPPNNHQSPSPTAFTRQKCTSSCRCSPHVGAPNLAKRTVATSSQPVGFAEVGSESPVPTTASHRTAGLAAATVYVYTKWWHGRSQIG